MRYMLSVPEDELVGTEHDDGTVLLSAKPIMCAYCGDAVEVLYNSDGSPVPSWLQDPQLSLGTLYHWAHVNDNTFICKPEVSE